MSEGDGRAAAAIEASWRPRRLFDTMTRRWKDRSLARDVGVDIVCVTTAAGVIFLVHRQFFRFDDVARGRTASSRKGRLVASSVRQRRVERIARVRR